MNYRFNIGGGDHWWISETDSPVDGETIFPTKEEAENAAREWARGMQVFRCDACGGTDPTCPDCGGTGWV